MRQLLSTHGLRADLELMLGLAGRARTFATQLGGYAPPDCAAAEECAALVTAGLVTTRGWR